MNLALEEVSWNDGGNDDDDENAYGDCDDDDDDDYDDDGDDDGFAEEQGVPPMKKSGESFDNFNKLIGIGRKHLRTWKWR